MLYVAAQNGHVRAVELLIAAKAKVNVQQKVKYLLYTSVCLMISTEWLDGIAHGQSERSL